MDEFADIDRSSRGNDSTAPGVFLSGGVTMWPAIREAPALGPLSRIFLSSIIYAHIPCLKKRIFSSFFKGRN